jgi:hypothetical protein
MNRRIIQIDKDNVGGIWDSIVETAKSAVPVLGIVTGVIGAATAIFGGGKEPAKAPPNSKARTSNPTDTLDWFGTLTTVGWLKQYASESAETARKLGESMILLKADLEKKTSEVATSKTAEASGKTGMIVSGGAGFAAGLAAGFLAGKAGKK